ncbi:hypothetical protein ACFL6C_05355 [Myxococcota bacterium]
MAYPRPMTNQRQHPIVPDRVRKIGKDGFAFIPNRFLHEGFFAALGVDELLLYFLLVVAGNRRGLSFYHYDSLCDLLQWPVERYVSARNSLIEKDLIAFDGTRFQVLELPDKPSAPTAALSDDASLQEHDPATIRALIRGSLDTDD